MRQIRTSGSMRERWRRGVGEILGHRQPKGPATSKASLRYRATSLLYPFSCSGHLGGGSLGLTFGQTHTVVISDNAAGYGWFVDPLPLGDTAFVRVNGTLVAPAGSPAAGSMDLLTVVLHEMGHLAGLPDLNSPADANDLMADMLSPGVRRDALDEFFAQGGL